MSTLPQETDEIKHKSRLEVGDVVEFKNKEKAVDYAPGPYLVTQIDNQVRMVHLDGNRIRYFKHYFHSGVAECELVRNEFLTAIRRRRHGKTTRR